MFWERILNAMSMSPTDTNGVLAAQRRATANDAQTESVGRSASTIVNASNAFDGASNIPKARTLTDSEISAIQGNSQSDDSFLNDSQKAAVSKAVASLITAIPAAYAASKRKDIYERTPNYNPRYVSVSSLLGR